VSLLHRSPITIARALCAWAAYALMQISKPSSRPNARVPLITLRRVQEEGTMMQTPIRVCRFLALVLVLAVCAGEVKGQTPVRVGWCTKVVTSAAAPYAI